MSAAKLGWALGPVYHVAAVSWSAPLESPVRAGRHATARVQPGRRPSLAVGKAHHLFPCSHERSSAGEGITVCASRSCHVPARLAGVTSDDRPPCDGSCASIGSCFRGCAKPAHGRRSGWSTLRFPRCPVSTGPRPALRRECKARQPWGSPSCAGGRLRVPEFTGDRLVAATGRLGPRAARGRNFHW